MHPDALDRPIGIYFGLDEMSYHSDVGLGSNDMKLLAFEPEEFFHQSKLSQSWQPDVPTPSQQYGTAMHKIVLEGREAFERRYGPCDYPGNIKAGMNEREAMRAVGRIPIKRDEWNRLQEVSAILRGKKNLAQAIEGGAGSEVSIFWICPRSGIKKKARIDRLKLRASVDLKSVANRDHVPFKKACRNSIDNYNYHIQSEHYREARMKIAEFVETGKVFGTPECSMDQLAAIGRQRALSWVFVFVQSSGAPLTCGLKLSSSVDGDGNLVRNPILELAAGAIARAESNWNRFMKHFGPDTPWLLDDPIEELAIEDFPPWAFRDEV